MSMESLQQSWYNIDIVRCSMGGCSSVISSCAKAGEVDEATKMFTEMLEADVQADVIIYSSLITACANAGNRQAAIDVFDAMLAGGLQPNQITYTAVLKCDCVHALLCCANIEGYA